MTGSLLKAQDVRQGKHFFCCQTYSHDGLNRDGDGGLARMESVHGNAKSATEYWRIRERVLKVLKVEHAMLKRNPLGSALDYRRSYQMEQAIFYHWSEL